MTSSSYIVKKFRRVATLFVCRDSSPTVLVEAYTQLSAKLRRDLPPGGFRVPSLIQRRYKEALSQLPNEDRSRVLGTYG